MMTEDEKSNLFWYTRINSHERKTLFEAGFKKPLEMLDLPMIVMMNLDRFGFGCLEDLTTALVWCFGKANASILHSDKEMGQLLGDINYSRYCRVIFVDYQFISDIKKALLSHGIDEKKLAKMTFRQLIQIVGRNFGAAETMLYVVIKEYFRIYQPPKISIKTAEDIHRVSNLFFLMYKQDD